MMNGVERTLYNWIVENHPPKYVDRVYAEYVAVMYGDIEGNECAKTEVKIALQTGYKHDKN